jgi:hypothetical protein
MTVRARRVEMRRRPMPPDVPVLIGASLIAYGAGAALSRSSRSSTHSSTFLAAGQPERALPDSPGDRDPAASRRLEAGQIGLDAVEDGCRLACDHLRVSEEGAFFRVAQETWLDHDRQGSHLAQAGVVAPMLPQIHPV